MNPLMDMLKRHEGFRPRVYCDRCGQDLFRAERKWLCLCPSRGNEPGNITVGIGTRVDGAGITEAEAEAILNARVLANVLELARFAAFTNLDPPRQTALEDMAFTMGIAGIAGFRKMWEALAERDWTSAAAAVLNSKWALEAPKRAREIASILRGGQLELPSSSSSSSSTEGA